METQQISYRLTRSELLVALLRLRMRRKTWLASRAVWMVCGIILLFRSDASSLAWLLITSPLLFELFHLVFMAVTLPNHKRLEQERTVIFTAESIVFKTANAKRELRWQFFKGIEDAGSHIFLRTGGFGKGVFIPKYSMTSTQLELITNYLAAARFAKAK